MVLLVVLALISCFPSLSRVHGVGLESVHICVNNKQYQQLTANVTGILQYDGQHVDCGLNLTGYPPNTPLAITNITSSTGCDGTQPTFNINGDRYCISNISSSLEVMLFDSYGYINISTENVTSPFHVYYYIADVLCQHYYKETIRADVTSEQTLSRLFITPAYVPGLRSIGPLDCSVRFLNPSRSAVSYILVLTGGYHPGFNSYGYFPGGLQEYNQVVTNDSSIPLDFYDPFVFDFFKSWIKYTVLTCVSPPPIRNGYFTRLPPSPWPTGTTLNISCNYGFENNGINSIECVLRDEQVSWNVSPHHQLCVPVPKCLDAPQEVANATYELREDNYTAVYKCVDGTISASGQNTEEWKCSTTDANNIPWSWTRIGLALNCAVFCLKPPRISNGTMASYNENKTHVYGDILYYQCDDGFTLLREKITCQGNGQWSNTPICIVTDDTSAHSSQSLLTNPAVKGLLAALIICLTTIVCVVVLSLLAWRKNMCTWHRLRHQHLSSPSMVLDPIPPAATPNSEKIYENMASIHEQRMDADEIHIYEHLQRRGEDRTYDTVA